MEGAEPLPRLLLSVLPKLSTALPLVTKRAQHPKNNPKKYFRENKSRPFRFGGAGIFCMPDYFTLNFVAKPLDFAYPLASKIRRWYDGNRKGKGGFSDEKTDFDFPDDGDIDSRRAWWMRWGCGTRFRGGSLCFP